MAKTPWEMADVGKEFSHQTALFAWAAMARMFGTHLANRPEAYQVAGYAKERFSIYTHVGEYAPIPELKWLHAIKNQGHGDRVRGSRSAAEGVRPGVFDVFLPVPTRYHTGTAMFGVGETVPIWIDGYVGLYMELKTPDRRGHKNGGASDEQFDFQADMRAQGYAAEIVHGWEDARHCLLTYLGKSPAT